MVIEFCEENRKQFAAKFAFPRNWKAPQKSADVSTANNEATIKWAENYGLHSESVIRKAASAVIPKESQQMLFPDWENEILKNCKESTAKYWLWIFLLDDLLEKCTGEEVNELSSQFMAKETNNSHYDQNSNIMMNSDSVIMSFINAYADLVDDFCDSLQELHPNTKPKEMNKWRQRLALGQFQYFCSTAEEVNKVDHVSTESDYLSFRSLGSAVAVYCLFVEAKNGIFDMSKLPKDFLLRLNQIYSVLSCFIGLLNDGFSYHREKKMDHVFNVIKFWKDHQYVKLTDEGYNRLILLLDRAYALTEELMTSFLKDYSYVQGVEGLIRDLRYGAVGFVNIHRNLKRYQDGPFTASVAFVEDKNFKGKTDVGLTKADDLPDLRSIFNVTDVQKLWGNCKEDDCLHVTEKVDNYEGLLVNEQPPVFSFWL